MPPEQLPWDRRDFRKHERSASDPRFGGGGFGGGGPHRWRDQHHHTHAPPPHPPSYQQQPQRWYPDFRSSRPMPSGHSKQGGWHVHQDDAGPGFMPFGSRYGDRHLEGENFQPLGSRKDGRYFRTNKENRGSISQNDWRSPWEPAATSSGPGRPSTEASNQKGVENSDNNGKTNESSHPLPDSSSGQSLSLRKEQERNDGTADGGVSSGQKSEKENGLESVDWKPLKWTRSGSLPSRGSNFSHLSGTKSSGVEFIETVAEVQQKGAVPVPSPSSSNAKSPVPASCDDISCRKKPRLGWGEGLAKYEKKKVEGPEDSGAAKDGLIVSITTTDTVQSPSVNLFDRSPRVASTSDCASPATPSSVACSSSTGTEEKESIRPANVDQENANLSCSPGITSQMPYEGPTFNLESIDLTSIAKLSSFLNELLQSEDPTAGETDCVQTTSMKKLLMWKVGILKALEVTESKIDSLETELKSLTAEPRSCFPCPATPSLLPEECPWKPCKEQVAALTVDPASTFQGVSTGNMNVESSILASMEAEPEGLKIEEINNPGGATYKIVEPSSGEDVSPPETAECGGFVNLGLINSSNLNLSCLENGLSHAINSCHVAVLKCISDSCHNDTVGNMRYGGNCSYDSAVALNKDSDSSASEEFNKLLPSRQCSFDISVESNLLPFQRNSSRVKERFTIRRQSVKFKEKVTTLKFRVFQHFWKEGSMVSVRKLRGKSQKILDMSQSEHKKHRSSSRSRIPCFAWNHQTVSAEDVTKFINGLLSESSFEPCRNSLKMPALILDKETKMSRFISSNGLVEDPCAVEKERSIINPWTAEEREVFIDKLAIYGKNFRKIASFLEHKTIADCIGFYYKNQKSERFARARKKPEFSEQRKPQTTTYLVATGKRWNREVNAASLNILGEASRGNNGPLHRANSLEIYSNETVAADVLAGICGSLSSEAMNSCITSSFDHADGYQDRKCARVGFGSKRPLTPDCMQNVDDECSDESCEETDSTDWTDEEKSIFIQAVASYGKDFDTIAELVRTKSKEQCRIFFTKARKCLGLDQIHHGAGHAASGDVNGGGSDIEDGCVVQTDSVTCNNNGPECKMEEDLLVHQRNDSHELDLVAATHDFKRDALVHRENLNQGIDSVAVEPVLKNSSIGDAVLDEKPVADHGASSEGKCVTHAESVWVEEGGSCVLANGTGDVDKGALPDSAGSCEGANGGKGHILDDDNLDAKKVEDRDANSGKSTVLSCARTDMKCDPKLAGNVSPVDACSSMHVTSGSQKQAGLDNFLVEKSRALSSHENGCSTSMESPMIFSVPITLQRPLTNNDPTNVSVSGISEKHSLEAVSTRDCHPLSDTVKSPQILKGYPVLGQSVKEIYGDDNVGPAVQHVNQQDINLHANQHTDFSIQNCSSNDGSGPSSGRSSDLDKPSRNGDVKLFGKVLISSQQKPNSHVQEPCSDNSVKLRFSADHIFDASMPKFDCNKIFSSANIPVRSYSFPDGNKTLLGFPSVPDSTLLLTKYPVAFSNHSKPTGKLELPSLQGVTRSSNDCPLNGVAVLPSSSSNSVADYQVRKTRDLQPFTKT